MPTTKDVIAQIKRARRASCTVSERSNPASVLQQKHASAVEAIGAMSEELIISRGFITSLEIQLMLTVRMKVCADELQRRILKEALILMADKSTCN